MIAELKKRGAEISAQNRLRGTAFCREVRQVVSALGEHPGGGGGMKTNFDVWKEGLTPELAQDIFAGYLNGDPCRHCPAIDFCGKIDGCYDTFTAWANAEAKEETK